MTREKKGVQRWLMAIFLGAIVASFFGGTFLIRVPKHTAQSISPKVFPLAIICLLAVTSLYCVIMDFRKPVVEEDRQVCNLLLSFLVMGISISLLDILGFLIIGFLFMCFEIAVVGNRALSKNVVLVSLACSVCFTALFRYGFNIGIPVLPFGIQ